MFNSFKQHMAYVHDQKMNNMNMLGVVPTPESRRDIGLPSHCVVPIPDSRRDVGLSTHCVVPTPEPRRDVGHSTHCGNMEIEKKFSDRKPVVSASLNLRAHKSTHSDHKQFASDVRSKSFAEADDAKKLKNTCDECSKTFTRHDHLRRHMLIHSGLKQYVCDDCSMAFSRADHLKKHKLTHSGHKEYVCDVCTKAFTRADHLKKHKRYHRGESSTQYSTQ